MDYTKNSCYIGKAGELRVRSELLLREVPVAVFDQDMGADMVLDNGKRIQVKTSIKPHYNKDSYSWVYSFVISARRGKSYKGEADYFICWCIEDNIFYIIPENDVGKKLSIVVPAAPERRKYKKLTWKKSTSRYEKYKNNWELLE